MTKKVKKTNLPKFDNPVFIDCDDTLILWDISEFPKESQVVINKDWGEDDPTKIVIHQKNVNLVRKFAKLGYDIIIWSRTGRAWAEAVAKLCGVSKYVSAYMSKPNFYIDDQPCRIVTGKLPY